MCEHSRAEQFRRPCLCAALAWAETPGEAFCAENQGHLEYSNGEMPFQVDEAVAWLTQQFEHV